MAQIVLISLYDEFCLGPRYITSVLRRAGHNADLVIFKRCLAAYETPKVKKDPEDYLEYFYASKAEIQQLQNFIRERNPLWVGFSFMSLSSGLAVELTKRIREVTKAPIAWGGSDTSVNPEWAIEHADMVCVGEGEHASLEITDALEGKRDLTTIRNLWVKENGRVVANEIRPLLQNLDELPYPTFDDQYIWQIDHDRMVRGLFPDCSPLNPWYIIMTSRGCPYRCSFCIHSAGHELAKGKGKYLRRRSVRNVIDELVQYKQKKPDVNKIMFYDDVFAFDRKWIAEFTDAYKKEVNVPFWVYVYPDMCDPEILKHLHDAGLLYVHMGIQTGSERVLREMYDRQLSPKKVLEASKTLKEIGIFPIYDMLIGAPFETEEDLRQSLELLLQLPEPFGLYVWPIVYYRNYKLSKEILSTPFAEKIRHVPGTNAAVYPEESPDLRFWISLFSLAKYPQVPRESIRSFLEIESLRKDPRPIEEMEKALFKAAFIPNTEFYHKDRKIEKLYHENFVLRQEVEHLKNKKAMKIQSRLEQVFGRR